MKSTQWKYFGGLILMVGGIFLAACGPSVPTTPTTDPAAVYTQAAETVQANLTLTAAAMPTSTPTIEPTATLEPTATITPTVPELNSTVMPGGANPTLPGVPAVPAATRPALAPSPTTGSGTSGRVGDVAEYQYQIPTDGSTFDRAEQFTLIFGVKNSGTTTWTTDYKLVFLGGKQLSEVTVIPVTTPVAPGSKYEFSTAARAPQEAGSYITRWKLVNNNGAFLLEVYLAFKVNE